MTAACYRGRFAPSPSGPLHFGSLIAATGSYLDARARGGEWLVRMDDLDPPREAPGAAAHILRTLEAFELHWDAEVMYQSRRGAAYEAALQQLHRKNLLFRCACTRREAGPVYPGNCRNGLPADREARSVRIRVPGAPVSFTDRLQGAFSASLAALTGDFIVRRADGLFAYHLACAVDDAEQKITDVVRGADLLESTCNQIWLLDKLEQPRPRYLHLPVAVNAQGEKLSKKTRAPALDPAGASASLLAALEFLGQETDPFMAEARPGEILEAAARNWKPQRIPPNREVPV